MSFQVPSDLYNRWFTVPVSTPHIDVDYHVMNDLMEKLPKGYTLPDPISMEILNMDE